ncbi:PEP-CTERM system histidine kinase PrsK [Candidatus Poribacteria bacterium]|nr:PEP-CTERM system histidine kinase PrsK [Candidatus Poribacteria bacterium]
MDFGYFMMLLGIRNLIWMRLSLISQCLVAANIVLFSIVFGIGVKNGVPNKFKTYLFPLYILYYYIIIFSNIINIFKFELSTQYGNQILLFDRKSSILIVFLFICTLIGIMNLEQKYRNLKTKSRKIRYPIIVFIGMLSFHLLVYSLGLGFSYIRLDVLSVASIAFIIANIFLIRPITSSDVVGKGIYISQSITARSYTLLMAGIYLLIIGLIGELIKLIGRNINYFIAFLATFFILLIAIFIILSKSIKQRFQLFIARNFYKSSYDYRKVWENFSREVFSTFDIKELLGKVSDTVSETIGTEDVSILLLDEYKKEFQELPVNKFEYDNTDSGDNLLKISMQAEFTNWLWRYGKPVIVKEGELKNTKSFSDFSDLPDKISTKFNDETQGILVPVIAKHLMIAVMIIGKREALPYSQEDLDLLETMSNQISIAIMNAKASQELAISKEMESFHKISTMLLHDLKSSATMLSLIIQNAADNFGDPEFQKDVLNTMSNVVERIQKLIRRLSVNPENIENKNTQPADLNEIIGVAISKSGIQNLTNIRLTQELSYIPRLILDIENIERVFLNIIMNAVEAIDKKGNINIKTHQTTDGYINVSISDNGCGMSKEFIRNKLFQPFQTSKEKGLGLGLYQSKAIVDSYDGIIDIKSEVNAGTMFTVKFPVDLAKEKQLSDTFIS